MVKKFFFNTYLFVTAISSIGFFLFFQKVNAAMITSEQTGNWSDSTTWVGGVVPGNGDIVTINSGHTVTVNNDAIVGNSSGAGTTVLTVNGDLVVNEDVTFTVRGDVLLANGKTITLAPGSIWQFDSSLAGGTIYKLLLAGNGKLITNGNETKRVTMRKAVGSGAWHIRYYQGSEGQIDANYTDFFDINGSFNGGGLEFYIGENNLIKFDHCTFNNSNKMLVIDIAPTGSFILTNNRWIGTTTTGAVNSLHVMNSGIPTTGERIIIGNTFDASNEWTMANGIADWVVEDNYFSSHIAPYQAISISPETSTTAIYPPASFKNNFFESNYNNSIAIIKSLGVFENGYFVNTTTSGNPHFIYEGPPINVPGVHEERGNIFEYTGTTDDGDAFLPTSSNVSGAIHNLHHNIVLPNYGGSSSAGSLFTYLGNDSDRVTINVYNNTYISGIQAPTFEEGNQLRSNLGIFKNNLQWDTVARGYKLRSSYGIGVVYGTATSVSENNSTLNFAAGNWITNYFKDSGVYVLKIVAGTNSGLSRVISSNTANQVTVETPFPNPCDTTSQFQIIVIDPMIADYNNGWNFLPGTVYDSLGQNPISGNGYLDMATSQVPGQHDLNVDPQFIDSTRNLAKWGQVNQGTDGSVSAALSVLQANPFLVEDLLDYVKFGFSPTNNLLKTAGFDGTDIGAMDVQTSPTYTLTYTAGDHGTLSGETTQTVAYGGTGTPVTANPDTGYHFVDWSDSSTDNPRTDSNVTANLSVTANFAINTYTLTVTQGDHGTISPGTTTVNYGDSQTFNITPDSGYQIVSVTVDGINQGAINSYTFSNVTANHTITASFAINTYTLTYTAGDHGTLSGETTQTVAYGGTGTPVTANPDTGYHFVDWSDSSTDNPRTDSNVTANLSVTANFAVTEEKFDQKNDNGQSLKPFQKEKESETDDEVRKENLGFFKQAVSFFAKILLGIRDLFYKFSK